MSLYPSLVAIICLLALASCGEKEEIVEIPVAPEPEVKTPPEEKNTRVIGVSIPVSDDFSAQIVKSIKAEAAKQDYKIEETPKVEFQSLIESKVQAIAISSDDLGADSAIEDAKTAGIPIFTFGKKSPELKAEIVSHIGTRFFEGGELAARAMIEALGESGGEILILIAGEVDVPSPEIRGFKKVIERFNSSRPEAKLTILSANSPSDTAASMLMDHPKLAGIFALSEPVALEAVSDLEKIGKQDKVTVIGFDLGKAGKEAVSRGKIYAAPTPSAEQIGSAVAESITRHLAGENVPAEQLVDMKLYRRTDASAESENRP